MIVSLLGGTGRVGAATLRHLLACGLEVRALVRDATRGPAIEPHLEVVTGSALDRKDVQHVVEGADAVVSALGLPPWSRGALVGPATQHLVDAARAGHGPRRIVCVSALGVGASNAVLSLPARLALALCGPYVRDKEEQERVLRASDAEWTLVRPWVMRAGPVSGDIAVGADGTIAPATLTFDDVGAFIAATVRDGTHVREAVCLGRARR